MRFFGVGLLGCAAAYGFGASTGRPTLGGLAGILVMIVADRTFGESSLTRSAEQQPLPAWLVGGLSILPVIGFVVIADGFDGIVETAPGAGWRALVLAALVLAYVIALRRSPPREEKALAGELQDASAAVRREIDAATRGR